MVLIINTRTKEPRKVIAWIKENDFLGFWVFMILLPNPKKLFNGAQPCINPIWSCFWYFHVLSSLSFVSLDLFFPCVGRGSLEFYGIIVVIKVFSYAFFDSSVSLCINVNKCWRIVCNSLKLLRGNLGDNCRKVLHILKSSSRSPFEK